MLIYLTGSKTISQAMREYIKGVVDTAKAEGHSFYTNEWLGVCFELIKACDKANVPVTVLAYNPHKVRNGGSRNSVAVKHGDKVKDPDKVIIVTYQKNPDNSWYKNYVSNQMVKGVPILFETKMFPYVAGLIR